MARVPRRLEGSASVELSAQEEHLLASIDGSLDEDELAFVTGMSPEQVDETLEQLAMLGLVTFGEPDALTQAPAEAEPAADDGVDLSAEERARVDEWFERVQEQDYYRLLGIPRDATRDEVKSAYYRVGPSFHPDKFYGRQLGSYKVKVETVFGALTRAHDTLRYQKRRAEYDASLPPLAPGDRIPRRKGPPAEETPSGVPSAPSGPAPSDPGRDSAPAAPSDSGHDRDRASDPAGQSAPGRASTPARTTPVPHSSDRARGSPREPAARRTDPGRPAGDDRSVRRSDPDAVRDSRPARTSRPGTTSPAPRGSAPRRGSDPAGAAHRTDPGQSAGDDAAARRGDSEAARPSRPHPTSRPAKETPVPRSSDPGRGGTAPGRHASASRISRPDQPTPRTYRRSVPRQSATRSPATQAEREALARKLRGATPVPQSRPRPTTESRTVRKTPSQSVEEVQPSAAEKLRERWDAVGGAARKRRLQRYVQQGRLAMQQGDYKTAAAAFEQALRLSPDDAELREEHERAAALALES